jgi:hypothetical protein
MAKEPAGLRRWRLSHKKNKKRGVTMARTRVKGRGKKQFTLSLAVAAGLAMPASRLINTWRTTHDINVVTRETGQFFTGYDWTTGKWSAQSLNFGLMPVAAGVIVHKLAGMIGINRAMANAGIPFIRI